MERSEVYSWRVDPRLKTALEEAARAAGTSVSRLLDRIVDEWLRRAGAATDQEEQQLRIRERSERYVGAVHGKDPGRARESSRRLKAILREKHARKGAG